MKRQFSRDGPVGAGLAVEQREWAELCASGSFEGRIPAAAYLFQPSFRICYKKSGSFESAGRTCLQNWFLEMLPVEIGFFHGVTRKAFWGLMPGRMRCTGKIYWSWREHKELSPGAQCLIHHLVAQLRPALEEVQPRLHQTQEKGQGLEMLSVTRHRPGVRSRCSQSMSLLGPAQLLSPFS